MGEIGVGRNKDRNYEIAVPDGKHSVKLTKEQKGDLSKVQQGGAKAAEAENDLAKSGITLKTISKEEYSDKLLTRNSDKLNTLGTDDKKLQNFLKKSHTTLLNVGDKAYQVLTNTGRPPSRADTDLINKAIGGDAGARAEVEKKGIKYSELTGGASQKASDFLAKHGHKA